MQFPPIAIVGRGCALPGALSPAALWDLVASGGCALTHLPQGRWRVPVDAVVPEHAPHDIGGYVTGFDEVFDPRGCDDAVLGDTAARWTLHAARQALGEAGRRAPGSGRSGLVLGWLALPDEALTRDVEQAWRDRGRLDARARRRHTSPAEICARALGFGAGSLALDAACASSLYALKLACDRLHDGSADLMLAGGVSAADPLLIGTGFTALSALSRSGRYRPLHREADGLIPAEGAALVALMRWADASARGIPVLGVIRGIGLSNDGRGEGLLVPSESGQARAMRQAYSAGGVEPESVTLLECHATGTALGDAVEVRSCAQMFAGAEDLAIGAVKANVGHAMTAAGAVGVLKVLAAIENGIRPLTAGLDDPIDALRGTALRVPAECEPWHGPRRAAVSAFGFGGNNAHVIIDAPDLVSASMPSPRSGTPRSSLKVAVVGVGARAGNARRTKDFTDAVLSGEHVSGYCDAIEVELEGLRVPPADLKAALARQVLVFEAAREAAQGVALPPERTQVLIATDCDPEIVRHTDRLRRAARAARSAPALQSEQVVGFLTNMTANRISSQLELTGASFAVGAQEAAGASVVALAIRAISAGDADAAVIGAVDVSCPSVGDEPADAGAVLVLKRLDHARRDGDRIMSIFDPADGTLSTGGATAEALVSLASTVIACHHRALPRPPRWHVFSGDDRAGVLAALEDGRASRGGPARLVIVADDDMAQRRAQARRWLLGQAPKPRWAAYRDQPLPGRIAAVFPGGAAAYVGMGAQLELAFPDLVAELVRQCPSITDVAAWVHDGQRRPSDTISCVWGAAAFAHLHTAITRDVLGIRPDAALGYSSGESTALTALGAWPDLEGLVRDLRSSPLFTRELAGSYDAVGRAWRRAGLPAAEAAWKTYLAAVPAEHARAAAQDEPTVYLMADNAPRSCTFGGEPAACERVLRRLGADRAIPLDYDLAVHAAVLEEVREQWHALHRRPTRAVPGVSFYSSARAEAYDLDEDSAADANTAQAVGTIDFRGTVERAWADGVRIFIEHGPSGGCADWITQTLGPREHVAVALDGPDASDVDNLARAVAELIAAGVDVDDARLADRFAAASGQVRAGTARPLLIDAHPAELEITIVPRGGVTPLRTHHALVGARHLDFINLLRHEHEGYLAQCERVNSLLLSLAALPPSTPAVLFDRADLEFLAVGPVSKLFGPAFAAQDGYARQTRMPGPPMLLADRVLSIDAEPATMGTGSIRTQTDVRPDSWYLDPAGRMPAGLMVEAGQADLLLISWLGADLRNRGERVYRLLGCEITYHGSPPHLGETLTFDIAVDGHAEHGGVRLFTFRYDCRVEGAQRLSVRNGQAGFFTDAELAATRGVLWDPPRIAAGTARHFDRDQVRAFGEGRPADCFGPDLAIVAAHVRTPRPTAPGLLLFDEADILVPDLATRATLAIRPDSWFFEGHFAADPCMPGTLMLEGCFQLMAFHLTASGCTVRRDGWRFEPVPERAYRISCRAQVTPLNRALMYELFVKEMDADGPHPTLVADVLCSADGVKAFLAEGLALRLVPDWPFDQWRWLGGLEGHVESEPVARLDRANGVGSMPLGLESLLACAWGRPSEMMGAVLADMDDGRRLARLPGPPYHFMSRIIELGDRSLVAEYDIPASAWFWDDGDGRSVPLCVLLEAALQPCGWLALHTGGIARAGVELLFRNLDGRGTLGVVARGTRVLRTEVRLLEASRTGEMIIDDFAVRVWADERLVAEIRSAFGFFPPAAFVDQPGLAGPAWRADEAAVAAPSAAAPPVGPPVGPMLALIDRITGFWPGERRMRAEKDVSPDDWYFRAHFFQDPVQPGSLGLEAMLQLVRCYLVQTGAAAPDSVFEPWLDGRETTWKYRGQVVPGDRVTVIEIEITESGSGYALAEAWLSVGGRTIYHATGLGVRFTGASADELLDPAVETWLADHRPTWTAPALPMMSIVDRLAAAAGRPIAGLRDIRLSRWIVLDGPVRLCARASGALVELEHDGDVVASATAVDEPRSHPPAPPLADARSVDLPYERGGIFHGPAFQYLTRLEFGSNGATGVLDAARGTVPRGRLHQGLLDATVHAIPHDELWRWSDRIRPGYVGYPYRLPWMDFFADLPASGELRVDARFAGFDGDVEILPVVDVQVWCEGRLLLAYRLVEILVPLGPLAGLDARERAAFLRDRAYVPGAGLSTFGDGVTRLRTQDLETLDWFPGTVADLYRLPPGADRLAEVAVRDHVARLVGVHPGAVVFAAGSAPGHGSATIAGRPGQVHRVTLEREGRAITVRDAG